MIRGLLGLVRRADLRRFVGVVALLAFAFVVCFGTAHLGDQHDATHVDHCGVCHSMALVGTSESFAAPQLTEVLDAAVRVAFIETRVPLAAQPRRSNASRAPPSLA